MYKTIHGTRRKHIRVMCREVDIGYSSAVGVENVLDRSLGRRQSQIPNQSFLIRGTDHPVITRWKR
jgi:hypothetical protein